MKQLRLGFLLLFVLTFWDTLLGQDKISFKESGEDKASLNGSWQFSIDSGLINRTDWVRAEYSSLEWDQLEVPGNWDTENRYSTFVGTGFYRKEFSIPTEWNSGPVRLCFGAVYQTAEVWLNGAYLGKHIGGYTPFEFEVSDLINRGGNNVLALSANNEYGRGAWWHWGGISREVKLIRTNDQRIEDQKVTAVPDLITGEATIKVDLKIRNHAKTNFTGRVRSFLIEPQNQESIEVTSGQEFEILADSSTVETFEFSLQPNNVQLWDINSPNVYTIVTQVITYDNKVIHESSDRFGIRKIEVQGDKLLLNGKELYLNGFNRVSDHWAYGQTEPDHLVKFDIDAMKAMGGNFARIMHHPQAPNLLDYCDEVGMLLIEEIPVWGKGDLQLKPDNPLTKQWLTEMINRDYNHPSIIGWSVGNEIADGDLEGRKMSPKVYKYVKSMINHVRSLDSSRLETYSSFTAGSVDSHGVDPADLCDIICFTSYGDASKVAKRIHDVWPNKPIFVSELGKSQLGEDLKSGLPESFERVISSLKELDYVVGSALWTYNDYRSDFADTPIGQCRTWGVYNAWRQPKTAAQEIQALYSTERPLPSLLSLTDMPESLSQTIPTIWAVVPVHNSCMIGFSVLNEEDEYDIQYSRNGSSAVTVPIMGLRGAAKIDDLEPGDYWFKIRARTGDEVGVWSTPYKVKIPF